MGIADVGAAATLSAVVEHPHLCWDGILRKALPPGADIEHGRGPQAEILALLGRAQLCLANGREQLWCHISDGCWGQLFLARCLTEGSQLQYYTSEYHREAAGGLVPLGHCSWTVEKLCLWL